MRQSAGQQSGSYVWNVAALPPGTYYPYAVIYDAKGIGKAYAPGALVIPPATQSGSIIAQPGQIIVSSASNIVGKVQVKLGSLPTSNVTVPLSVSSPRGPLVSPSSLSFTPQNWSTAQTVTVTAQAGCSSVLQSYDLLIGRAISLDPNYIGLSATNVTVNDLNVTPPVLPTNIVNVNVCHLTQLSAKKVGQYWEYTYQAELTNGTLGAFNGVTATASLASSLFASLYGMSLPDNQLSFGAVASGETVRSADTIRVRSLTQLPILGLPVDLMLKWSLQTR